MNIRQGDRAEVLAGVCRRLKPTRSINFAAVRGLTPTAQTMTPLGLNVASARPRPAGLLPQLPAAGNCRPRTKRPTQAKQACVGHPTSFFDEQFQTGKGFVPLGRNRGEERSQVIEGTRIEDEAAFAASTRAVDDAGSLQHPKVLRDGLARETRTASELRDGTWLSVAKLGEQRQPRLVAESGEDRRLRPLVGG